jgi:hemoglobin
MTNVDTADFQRWLDLFGVTVQEVFAPEAQLVIIAAARRIATSLWLAMTADPFSTPPDWSASGKGQDK